MKRFMVWLRKLRDKAIGPPRDARQKAYDAWIWRRSNHHRQAK